MCVRVRLHRSCSDAAGDENDAEPNGDAADEGDDALVMMALHPSPHAFPYVGPHSSHISRFIFSLSSHPHPMNSHPMKVMMADPAVKERMKRMLSKLGSDSALGGGSALADDPDALDKIFERMQDPETIEKLQEYAKSDAFRERMQTLAADEGFSKAASEYAGEMRSEIESEMQGSTSVAGMPSALDDEDDEEEEL